MALEKFIRITRWMVSHIAIPVGIAMILGIIAGYFTPKSIAEKLHFTVIIGLFWMLYPMMIDLKMSEMKEIFKRPKRMGTSLFLNFVVSPLIIGPLVLYFLASTPRIGAGLMLVGISPCSAMNTAATAFVGGNIELTLGIVSVSYLLTIIAVPIWATLFMGRTVPVPFGFMVRQIALVILVPMFFGWLTRMALKKKMGEERYLQIVPSFEGFSFLGVLFMIFFLFVLNAHGIIAYWHVMVNVVLLSIFFFSIMMLIAILVPRALRFSYPDSASITVTSVAKNESIAMALAFMLYGPTAAMSVAIGGVLVQVPFMVSYIQFISKRLRNFYPSPESQIKKS
ncbi:MAG: arsenic resistance protein [Euryarchaeota archaeon]|nr:arsenic resistance protein [Euryarchaeota archaeon]